MSKQNNKPKRAYDCNKLKGILIRLKMRWMCNLISIKIQGA